MTAPDPIVGDRRDPAEIEREIRNTQAEMSRTVDQLGDRLTPKNVLAGLLGKPDGEGLDARDLLDIARRNPLAVAMIAAGAAWLAGSARTDKGSAEPGPRGGNGAWDDHHRGYVAHMSRVERLPDEDEDAYRRRRDIARANYLMIEQRHDEDEGGFRRRLDEATEALRRRRDELVDRTRGLGAGARDTAGSVAGRTSELYASNPLVGGIVAALLGALAGAAAPVSRTERDRLGALGAKALDAASETTSDIGAAMREKKDELVETAARALEPAEGSDRTLQRGAPESSAGPAPGA